MVESLPCVARQLRRIERSAERRVTEHDGLGATVLAGSELLLQRRERDVTDVDHPPPRLRLRRRDLVANERLPNVEPPVEEFHVLPAQAEQFAPTHPGRERDGRHATSRREPVGVLALGPRLEFPVGFKDGGDVGGSQRLRLHVSERRRVYEVERVLA